MINYATPRSKTSYWYCKKCYNDKMAQEEFANKVCSIFGIKTPGPRIWTERKRLIDTYGYTDETIVNCLDYIYNVLKKPKKVETIYLVNPTMVDEMMRYRRNQHTESLNLVRAIQQTEYKEYIVSIQESKNKKKEILDSDEWLDID